MNWVFFIPDGGNLHSHRRENLKSYISFLLCAKNYLLTRFADIAVSASTA
jgi:hypothetical protein